MFPRRIFSFSVFSRTFIRDFSYYSFVTLSWIPVAIFANDHVGECTTIVGASMYPFLNTDYNNSQSRDWCWIKKYNAHKSVERGMIVAFRSPSHPEVIAAKRVIGVAGDKVYTRAPCPIPMIDVPANHIWVEGDNKDGRKSLDSNHYGPIPLSLVTGKVTTVLWPWKSSGAIRWEEFKVPNRVIKGRKEDALAWD